MRTLKLTTGVLLILIAVACGSGKSSPVSPTSPTPATPSAPTPITGATIIGSVQTGSGLLAASNGANAAAGLTVQIVGTNMSTTIGSSGQFTFTGVPAGPVQLNFSGPGINASVSLTPVTSTQTVTIRVIVSGSNASLEEESQDDHGESEVNGIVSGLTGTASSFQFTVGSRVVHGDAQTQFFGDGDKPDSFTNLKNGVRVEVKGTLKDTFVYANRIHVNDGSGPDDNGTDNGDNGDNHGGSGGDNGGDNHDQEAEASGAISGLGGSCPSITFSLGSQGVQTNGSTTFAGVSCSSLKNGNKVEVSGTKQSNGTILADKVKKD